MALPKHFEESIKLYQSNPHLPVWLKAGARDRILFGITVALCGVGLVGVAHFGYTMALKR